MISLKIKLYTSDINQTSKVKNFRNYECGIFEWSTSSLINKFSYLFPIKKYSCHTHRFGTEAVINFKEDVCNWLDEIEMKVSLFYEESIITIIFNKEEDAILFKMTWM